MTQTSRVKCFQRCGLFSTHEISICGTKMVNAQEGTAPFRQLIQNQCLRVNPLGPEESQPY
jgi:hypothetical protein